MRDASDIPDVDPQLEGRGADGGRGFRGVLQSLFDEIPMVTGEAGMMGIELLRKAFLLAQRAKLVGIDLDRLPGQFRYHVICGRTGSGKSRLLEALAEHGAQVLDLEKLAAHKGSVLGDLPDEVQPAQKLFESRLWRDLSGFDTTRTVYVEAESKKVGNLRVPQSLIEQMWQGTCFEVVTPAPLRIRLLREEYSHLIDNCDLLFQKLDCLKALHPTEQIDAWKNLVLAGQWDDFIADMLTNHYDPAYERSMFNNYVNARLAVILQTLNISRTGFASLAADLPR